MGNACAALARCELERCLRAPDDAIDVVEASMFIALEDDPELDIAGCRARLAALCDGGRRAVLGRTADADPRGAIAALNGFLFDEQGFRGNEGDYYDPRNSYINEVLARGTGIPITLSVIYMAVARAAAMPMVGIGLPGHFIVRTAAGPPVYVDPYNRGAILTLPECERIARTFLGNRRAPVAPFLAPVAPRRILARMLTNLKGIYLKAGDDGKAAATLEKLMLVDGSLAIEERDLGLLYLRQRRFPQGYARLRHYVATPATGAMRKDQDEIERVLHVVADLAFPVDRYAGPLRDA
ncbi:MAG: transglutaminase-like domain-containing protein [Acidobacteriota bacterium]